MNSQLPATMAAAYVERLGPADSIRYDELPVPVPGPTDVLVEVHATTVNPVDAYVRSGAYPTPTPFPFVLGRDLVGAVVRTDAADRFREGDAVWCNSLGHDGRQGANARYAVVPADRLYRLPDDVDPLTCVALAHPAATAYLGWFVHAGLRPGDTVYVGGGAGNVGRAAVTMARQAGARVVAGARPEDHDECRRNGADTVVDYRDPYLADTLRERAPDGVRVFWDTSGRQDLSITPDVVAPGGRILVTAAGAAEPTVPVRALYVRDVAMRGFVISRARVDDLAAAASAINGLLSAGLLETVVAGELALSDAADAHERVESGEVRGRLVLRT